MRRQLFTIVAKVSAIVLVSVVLGCSKVTVYVDGEEGSGSQPDGSQTLVSFHATVESRNLLSRSMSPLSKNIQVRMFVFEGISGGAKGPLLATGQYESSMPGILSGVDGYKMLLVDGVYNFYGVSENLPYSPINFTDGKSEPLFNGIDYLWWGNLQQDVSSAQLNIPIVFMHCASQVVIEVIAGEGVTLNQLIFAHISVPEPGASMELSTGIIPPATTYGNAISGDKMGINGTLAQYIILPLKTTVPMKADFTVLINGETNSRTYEVDVPVPDGELLAGNSYHFEVIIGTSNVELSSVNVKDWIDVDETGNPLYPK